MQVGDKIILGRLNKRQVGSMDASAFGQLLIRSMKKTKTVYRTEIEKYLSKKISDMFAEQLTSLVPKEGRINKIKVDRIKIGDT